MLLILGGRDTFYQVRTRRQTNSRFGMVCCVGYEVRSKRGTWAHVQGWLRECSRRSVGLESYCNTVKGPPGLLCPTEPLCVPGVAGLFQRLSRVLLQPDTITPDFRKAHAIGGSLGLVLKRANLAKHMEILSPLLGFIRLHPVFNIADWKILL